MERYLILFLIDSKQKEVHNSSVFFTLLSWMYY